ncbi:MAG: hypothetical protein JWL86_44 [Rhizobium sp.]|nr:hypothetical protein [Rhizobium sp.]
MSPAIDPWALFWVALIVSVALILFGALVAASDADDREGSGGEDDQGAIHNRGVDDAAR